MLSTPFGEIGILVDGEPIPYVAKELTKDEFCPDVLGRYHIEVDFIPDGDEHEIACVFSCEEPYKRGPESGELLECQAFYNQQGIKMSIGLHCEGGYEPNEPDHRFDYDCCYLENGMAYVILKVTKTEKYVFGIAWIDGANWDDFSEQTVKREFQTWWAADPIMS